MAQYATFAICHQRSDFSSYEYELNTSTATYLSSCINVFRSMVSTQHVRNALIQHAISVDQLLPSTWYRQHLSIPHVIDSFLNAIRTNFPVVWVDETITNPAVIAHHPRGQWQGHFNPRAHAVCINALVCSPNPGRPYYRLIWISMYVGSSTPRIKEQNSEPNISDSSICFFTRWQATS